MQGLLLIIFWVVGALTFLYFLKFLDLGIRYFERELYQHESEIETARKKG